MFDEKELKVLLTRKGKTLKELADFLGISKVTLYRKMRGESDFYRDEISKCCLFFEEENLNHIFFAQKVT